MAHSGPIYPAGDSLEGERDCRARRSEVRLHVEILEHLFQWVVGSSASEQDRPKPAEAERGNGHSAWTWGWKDHRGSYGGTSPYLLTSRVWGGSSIAGPRLGSTSSCGGDVLICLSGAG